MKEEGEKNYDFSNERARNVPPISVRGFIISQMNVYKNNII